MKHVIFTLELLLLLIAARIFNPWPQLFCNKDVTQDFRESIKRDQVTITCSAQSMFGNVVFGGQGTVIGSSKNGAIVITAAHVIEGMQDCTIVLRDHTAHEFMPRWIASESDIAELYIPDYVPTHVAKVAPIRSNESIFTFGYVEYSPVYNNNKLVNFLFDFSNEFYCGEVLSKVPSTLLLGYGGHRHNIYMANIFADHGSSGEGVFDSNGNLVAIVSGGTSLGTHSTYIVDTEMALRELNK
jgi:hypothetical protein